MEQTQKGFQINSGLFAVILLVVVVTVYFIFFRSPAGIKDLFPLNDKSAQYIIQKSGTGDDKFIILYTRPNGEKVVAPVFVSLQSGINLEEFSGKEVRVEGKFVPQMEPTNDCSGPACDHQQVTILRIEKIKIK